MEVAMNPVNWFEIPVTEIARAKNFYEQVLGIPLELHDFENMRMAFFPMTMDAYGAAGALVTAEGYVPSGTGVIIYFSVEDIEAILAKAADHGGKILIPKMGIGEYGFIGHFIDTEGNRLGLHSMK
jgi:predicted enzyme related to lactoylglutathione lyase